MHSPTVCKQQKSYKAGREADCIMKCLVCLFSSLISTSSLFCHGESFSVVDVLNPASDKLVSMCPWLPWYDVGESNNPAAPLPDDAVPSTITFDRVRQGMIVRANLSANKLLAAPSLQPQLPVISLFKESVLAGITKKLHLKAIVEAAIDGKLFLSGDGSYQHTSKLAAYSWTIRGHNELGEGSGCLEAEFNSPYRAELYGILASLLILQHVEETCTDIQGTVTIVSDCQRVLRHALQEGPAGVKTAMQDEYDVILAIHQLQTQLKL